MEIIEIYGEEKRRYMPLLLLADESEEMLGRYLDAGDMYVLFAHGRAVAEAVVTRREDGCELKNIATEKDARGKGYATRLLAHLFRLDLDESALLMG